MISRVHKCDRWTDHAMITLVALVLMAHSYSSATERCEHWAQCWQSAHRRCSHELGSRWHYFPPVTFTADLPYFVGFLHIISTGDDYSHRQGRNCEFCCLCITVGPVTGLLTYWPSPLSGGLGMYASLIGFNPRRLKVLKRGWAPTQRT